MESPRTPTRALPDRTPYNPNQLPTVVELINYPFNFAGLATVNGVGFDWEALLETAKEHLAKDVLDDKKVQRALRNIGQFYSHLPEANKKIER